MKKLFVLTTFLLTTHFPGNGQNYLCPVKMDTVYFIKVSSNAGYPFVMYGISRAKHDLREYRRSDIRTFVNSLYSYLDYVPDIDFPFSVFSQCMGREVALQQLSQNRVDSFKSNFYQNLHLHNFHTSYTLGDYSLVQIDVSRVYGSFWVLDKSTLGAGFNRETYSIQDMPQIKNCYYHFEIIWYQKPRIIKW